MKLIKKIAAIMFAFMMVFSLGTNVKAEEGVNQNNGSITINNAKANETYRIYRILDLDSYNYTDGKPDEGNYSYTYKQTGNNITEWKKFVNDNAAETGNKFFDVTDDKYVTAKNTDGEKIAKAALAFVTDTTKSIQADSEQTPSVDGPISFSDLPLGYYLVESSVGALCSLKTTNPSQAIEVKYTEPTVEKKISVNTNDLADMKTVNIGDQVHYEVKITVGKGAKNYVFHDKIDTGLQYVEVFGKPHVDITTNRVSNTISGTDYYLSPDPNSEIEKSYDDEKKNSFTLKFVDSFIQKLKEGDVITLKYSATVTSGAPMDTAIKNTAYLNYGNSQKTNEDYTSVFTYQVPVWKYTTKGNKVGLPGAKFKLYKNKDFTEIVPLKQKDTTNEYIYTPENVDYSLISDTDGNLVIKGLAAGEYYLEETEAPKGYNKLTKAIKITISHSNGNKQIKVDGITDNVTIVEVENKTGSILPSTGGMGTALIYLIGGALVLGSGIVLANKKRAKAK